ncbi:FG-GAP repeat domain-containing protein [Paraliomyxa miuraensis]|uniref:FG-GAP repeat domain-containing protein n=1 Tax=Paraliomyxa miuraensis TaxID=376150 RepID=UPI0022578E75|nr:VCBS repeat-containing protein [Paraliomyxa miuraensis]MCX4245244.1 VCBS repeat-containing protein [Paraliomyxa miuraensis]
MPRPTTRTSLRREGLALRGLAVVVLALVPSACVDRVIHDRICGDGRLSPGEVCLGEGFQPAVTIDALAPLALRVADFGDDGRADLMVLGLGPAGSVTAQIWAGDGAGGFVLPVDPGLTGCSAHPALGHIDDDEILDVLIDDCAPTMSLFRGTPTGVYEPAITVTTGVATTSSAMLDLDGDGRREVVVLGPDADGLVSLSVSERQPGGAFDPPALSPLVGPAPDFQPSSFGVLDHDGDPHSDLLLVHGGRVEGLGVALGSEGLWFSQVSLVAPPGLRLDGATVRDLDGDGRDEVLAISFEDEALIVLDLPPPGSSLFVERNRSVLPGLSPGPAVLDDLDADGNLDLLRVQPGSTRLEVWLGDPDGRFDGPTLIELDAPVDQIAVADLDHDGALDIVVGSFEEAVIRVLLSDP